MYKLAVLSLLVAAASAGFIGAPLAHGPALAIGHAPLAYAPAVAVAHAPVASSYSNTVRVVHNSVPVVRTVAAPVAVAHAPIVAAPLIAHGPALYGHGGLYGHGYH